MADRLAQSALHGHEVRPAADLAGAVGVTIQTVGPESMVLRHSFRLIGRRLVTVGTPEVDAGVVIVHLSQRDRKLPNGVDHQGREQGGAVGAVQAIQGPPESIIPKEIGLAGLQGEVF